MSTVDRERRRLALKTEFLARELSDRMASLKASGGLPALRGHAEPLVLAQLDRRFVMLHKLSKELLMDVDWCGEYRKDLAHYTVDFYGDD